MTQYFDGETFEPGLDGVRLTGEMSAVFTIMRDGNWRTFEEIQDDIIRRGGKFYPVQAISARLRDCRKVRFGRHTVNRRRRGNPHKGLFEYQLILRHTVVPTSRKRIIPRQ